MCPVQSTPFILLWWIFLKAHDMDSSFSNRTKLAHKYGMKEYHGTPAQNIALLRFLEGGH
jgi:hypothetical protein